MLVRARALAAIVAGANAVMLVVATLRPALVFAAVILAVLAIAFAILISVECAVHVVPLEALHVALVSLVIAGPCSRAMRIAFALLERLQPCVFVMPP